MKVFVDTDEWYPVASIYTKLPYEGCTYSRVDIPEELLKAFKEAREQFARLNKQILTLMENANDPI